MKWCCRGCYFIRFSSIILCELNSSKSKWINQQGNIIKMSELYRWNHFIIQLHHRLPSLFRLSYFLRYKLNSSLLFLQWYKNDTWRGKKNSGRKNRLLTLLLREKKKVFQSDKMKETEESGYNYIVKLLNRFTPSTSEEWL